MTILLKFILFLTVGEFARNAMSYNPMLSYNVRFKRFVVLPNITANYTIDQYKDKQYYINGNIKIDSKLMIDKVEVVFDRCNSEGIDCEYFQTWTLNDVCNKLKEKNQIWSRWYSSFDPPMICPINKVYYQINNGTIDIGPAIRLYSDATNYQWKVKQILYSGNVIVGSYTMELSIFGYRKKSKSLLSI